jgi:hypothetical protein
MFVLFLVKFLLQLTVKDESQKILGGLGDYWLFQQPKIVRKILEGRGRENKIWGGSIFHSKFYRGGSVFVAVFQAQI